METNQRKKIAKSGRLNKMVIKKASRTKARKILPGTWIRVTQKGEILYQGPERRSADRRSEQRRRTTGIRRRAIDEKKLKKIWQHTMKTVQRIHDTAGRAGLINELAEKDGEALFKIRERFLNRKCTGKDLHTVNTILKKWLRRVKEARK